jgi:hypothetical protein
MNKLLFVLLVLLSVYYSKWLSVQLAVNWVGIYSNFRVFWFIFQLSKKPQGRQVSPSSFTIFTCFSNVLRIKTMLFVSVEEHEAV